MMKDYTVYGKITFDVETIITAESEEAAIAKANENLKDYYHLDVVGADHNPDEVVIELDVIEYEN